MNGLPLLLLTAQLFLSGSERFEYWSWTETREERLVSDFDLTGYYGDFTLGGRFYILSPASFRIGERRLGFLQRYLTYRSDAVEITAGSFYKNIGYGLMLRAVRDDEVLLDRFLDGVDLLLRRGPLQLSLFSGRPRSILYYETQNDTSEVLRGAAVTFTPSSGTEAGLHYLRRNLPAPLPQEDFKVDEFYGAHLSFSLSSWAFYGEGVLRKGWNPLLFADTTGYGLYGYLSFSGERFGVLVEGKHYRRIRQPYATPPPANHYGRLTTEGRDESGGAVELSLYPSRTLQALLHFSESISSDRLHEITEAYGELRLGRPDRLLLTLALDGVRFLRVEPGIEERIEITPDFYLLKPLPGGRSLDLHYQHRIRRDDGSIYPQRTLTLGVSPSPSLTLSLTYQDSGEGDSLQTWVRGEALYRLGPAVDLGLYVGAQRADLVCSGGVCRYEPAFKGFKTQVLVRF